MDPGQAEKDVSRYIKGMRFVGKHAISNVNTHIISAYDNFL